LPQDLDDTPKRARESVMGNKLLEAKLRRVELAARIKSALTFGCEVTWVRNANVVAVITSVATSGRWLTVTLASGGSSRTFEEGPGYSEGMPFSDDAVRAIIREAGLTAIDA